MSAGPWLSVVMPTYQGVRYLTAALDSVAREPMDGIEIVVADDGSTDGTAALLARYARALPLRIVQRERVGSWVRSSNAALRAAAGEYACFLHQDDAWLPGRIAAVRRAIARAPEATLVLHAARFMGPRAEPLGAWNCPLGRREGVLAPAAIGLPLLVQNFIAIPSPTFRREAALALGALDEALWYTADWDLWLKLAAAGPTYWIPQALAAFRVHPESQTMSDRRGSAEFDRQLRTVLDRHLDRWPVGGRRALVRAARYSVALNAALAGASRGEPFPWRRLALGLVALGPGAGRTFLRDSRIVERLGARLRLRWRGGARPPIERA